MTTPNCYCSRKKNWRTLKVHTLACAWTFIHIIKSIFHLFRLTWSQTSVLDRCSRSICYLTRSWGGHSTAGKKHLKAYNWQLGFELCRDLGNTSRHPQHGPGFGTNQIISVCSCFFLGPRPFRKQQWLMSLLTVLRSASPLGPSHPKPNTTEQILWVRVNCACGSGSITQG